jgi:myosin heavy subunit
MKSISLNFFGEQVTINVPTDLSSLRKEIADKFMFSPSDAAEIVLSYMKDLGKKIIQTEQDFTAFISNKIGKIDLDISPDSKLFLKNLDTLKKEKEEAQKELDECLKKKEELKKEKDAKLNEEKEKLKNIEKKIKKLVKKKKNMKIKIQEEKKKFETEEKENDEKIKQLKEKLGIKEEKQEKKSCKKLKSKNRKLRGKKNENKKETHYLVSCDGCHMSPLVGRRYKCETCPNFDFCEHCYQKEREKHGHQFKVVETKELVKQVLEKVSLKPQNSEGKAIHRWVSCNGCGMNPIVGTRYKCSVCDNFDYCENCEQIYKNEHSHEFIKISKPNMEF